MPGPKPAPRSLKLLKGETRPSRVPQHEPKPRPLLPDCPDFLSARAKVIWNQLIPELDYMGVLTVVDQSVLAGYCDAYALAQDCTEYLRANGLTHTSPSGYEQQRPQVAIANKAWDKVAKFGAELGIGAASRSRIEVKKPDDADKDTAAEILGVTAR